ncbi:MAG: hypothetical protein NVS2B17_31060 [Candidatus Velthaea sp.]
MWANDVLARPVVLDTEYDPERPSRVVIVVRRRFPPYLSQPAARVATPAAMPARPRRPARAVATPATGRIVMVNGRPVPYEKAMAEVRQKLR